MLYFKFDIIMPKQCCKGVLIPMHKQNIVKVTDNSYRGVGQSSCLLFTTIIDEQLKLWANKMTFKPQFWFSRL